MQSNTASLAILSSLFGACSFVQMSSIPPSCGPNDPLYDSATAAGFGAVAIASVRAPTGAECTGFCFDNDSSKFAFIAVNSVIAATFAGSAYYGKKQEAKCQEPSAPVMAHTPAPAATVPEQEMQLTGVGTCFAASRNGIVVTANHVIEDADVVGIQLADTQTYTASVIATSPKNDLAILQINANTPNFIPLASEKEVSLGDTTFTIGFPAVTALGWEPKLTDGVVSSLSVAGDDSLMQISVPVHPGNSGGPLINQTGQVIGVVVARAADRAFLEETGSLPQNVGFAVNAKHLRTMGRVHFGFGRRIASRRQAIRRAEKAICKVGSFKRN
jgi:S1-C subfamily serine protease